MFCTKKHEQVFHEGPVVSILKDKYILAKETGNKVNGARKHINRLKTFIETTRRDRAVETVLAEEDETRAAEVGWRFGERPHGLAERHAQGRRPPQCRGEPFAFFDLADLIWADGPDYTKRQCYEDARRCEHPLKDGGPEDRAKLRQ